ncbi:hypothetical protein [Streptomyces sp. HUAS TT7]|uniref:hypothetical protein n=1 Tax=Streptomyces sp. HUAS TT7 TaxID=3447507 RepID=UPI003F6558ED
MRVRTPRRLVAVALSTAIVIGSAETAMAADFQLPRSVRADVPVPGSDALLAQIKQLGPLGPLLSTVTDLLNGVLGGASPADATALAAKATAALDAVKSEAPAAPTAPGLPVGGPQKSGAPTDIKDDAIAAAKKAIADLVAAVTKGDVVAILAAATAVLTGLIGVILAALLGGGLPLPALPGLPLPQLPVPLPGT